MLVPDTSTAGRLAQHSDAFLLLGSVYEERNVYTWRLELWRCKGPASSDDRVAGGFLQFPVVHWISIAVREHKFLQPAQHSSAECCFLASLELQFLSCPFQPQSTATKFKCYQNWPVFKQGRVYTCMIQPLLRSTFTTKVINLSMKQIIFWALQDMANLTETGKCRAHWKKINIKRPHNSNPVFILMLQSVWKQRAHISVSTWLIVVSFAITCSCESLNVFCEGWKTWNACRYQKPSTVGKQDLSWKDCCVKCDWSHIKYAESVWK